VWGAERQLWRGGLPSGPVDGWLFAVGLACLLWGAAYVVIGLVVRRFYSEWYDREVVPGHPMRISVQAAPFLLIAGLLLVGVAWIRS
jgi:hypothetical protein